MAKIRSGFLSFLKALWDNDRDTGVEVERTADDDTVRVHAGGNTDIVKVTSLKVHVNADGRAVAIQFDGDGKNNVFYLDPTNDGIVMGGTKSTFLRSGATIKSAFVSVKPDEANWNAGAQIIYTDQPLRTVDFSLLKARGTEASPAAVILNDDITNFRIEGHDGTDFEIAALIRVAVDGTVSAGVVPGALYFSVANPSGVVTQALAIRSSGNIGTNGRGSPLSSFDFGGSLGLTRRAVAANTSTTATDIIIAVTSTAAPRTVDLRTADTVGRRTYIIKDESGGAAANNITVTTEGAQLIDGAATYVINTNYGSVRLYSNGTNWFTF